MYAIPFGLPRQLLIFLFFLPVCSNCQPTAKEPANKAEYLQYFSDFVDYIEDNQHELTQSDYKSLKKTFIHYAEHCYNQYDAALTTSEEMLIVELKITAGLHLWVIRRVKDQKIDIRGILDRFFDGWETQRRQKNINVSPKNNRS